MCGIKIDLDKLIADIKSLEIEKTKLSQEIFDLKLEAAFIKQSLLTEYIQKYKTPKDELELRKKIFFCKEFLRYKNSEASFSDDYRKIKKVLKRVSWI